MLLWKNNWIFRDQLQSLNGPRIVYLNQLSEENLIAQVQHFCRIFVPARFSHGSVSFNACLSDVKFNESKLLWECNVKTTFRRNDISEWFLMDETISGIRSATSCCTKIINIYLLQHLKIVHRCKKEVIRYLILIINIRYD